MRDIPSVVVVPTPPSPILSLKDSSSLKQKKIRPPPPIPSSSLIELTTNDDNDDVSNNTPPPPLPKRPPLVNMDSGTCNWINENFVCTRTKPHLEHLYESNIILQDVVLVKDDLIVVAEAKNVRAIELKGGDIIWTMTPADFLQPVVICRQSPNVIIVGTADGHVFWVDVANGKVLKENLVVHGRNSVAKILVNANYCWTIDSMGRMVQFEDAKKKVAESKQPLSSSEHIIVSEGNTIIAAQDLIPPFATNKTISCVYQEPSTDHYICGFEDGTIYYSPLQKLIKVSYDRIDCLIIIPHSNNSYGNDDNREKMNNVLIWCADSNRLIRIIDVSNWNLLTEFTSSQRIRKMNFVEGGSQILAWLFDRHSIELWDATLQNYFNLLTDSSLFQGTSNIITNLTVRLATWNVAGASPPGNEKFWYEWLFFIQPLQQEQLQSPPPPPDLIVIALQEVMDLGTLQPSLVLDQASSTSPSVSKEARLWINFLEGYLKKSSYNLVNVTPPSQAGLVLLVFSSIPSKDRLLEVEHVDSKTIPLGPWGTKGAVAVRLVINLGDQLKRSMCFVNCHLPSGLEAWQIRNDALNDILKGLTFRPLCRMKHAFIGEGMGREVWDHHITFIMGDLNYRLTCPDRLQVLEMTRQEKKACDQLTLTLSSNSSSNANINNRSNNNNNIQRFQEVGDISFFPGPTYKYDKYTTVFDSSDKQRIPAYCDRILQRIDPCIEGTCMEYTSIPDQLNSDHKPVKATIHLAI